MRGDPADGKATITAAQAKKKALSKAIGFIGAVSAGTPILVQLDDAYAGVIATAWAIPMSGSIELSDGAVPTTRAGRPVSDIAPTVHPVQKVVIFIDAVNGDFISEEGFASAD